MKVILTILIALSFAKTETIEELCENVGLYNAASTINNSLVQTTYEKFGDALKKGEPKGEGSFGQVVIIDFREEESRPI